MNVKTFHRKVSTRGSSHAHLITTRWLIDIGVKIILGTIHELSLQGFGGYAPPDVYCIISNQSNSCEVGICHI
jgi:hypothetical protein